MTVNLKTISEQTGVSVSTVSHILSGRTMRYSAKTKDVVFSMAKELGYSPNGIARALVTGRTQRIAFWSPSMGSRFFQEVAYQFHKVLMKDKYEMLAGEIGPQMMNPANAVGLTRRDVDGVLIYGGLLGHIKPIMESDFPMKAPIVNMGPHCVGPLDFVSIDLYPASCQAVRSLLDAGRTRVAHILTTDTYDEFDDRYRGYNDAMREYGMKAEYIVIPDWSRNAARQTVLKYVKENGCPDGLFCANDEIATGAYRGLRDIGIRIPDQVLMIGCDGIEDLEFLDPPISTIAHPLKEMCDIAWKFLKRRMENPEISLQTESLQAKLEMRN